MLLKQIPAKGFRETILSKTIVRKASFTASVFSLIILIYTPPLLALTPIVLSEGQGEYIIGEYIEYLEDKNKDLTIDEVISPELNKKFIPSDQKYLNFGYTSSAYWLRFKLKASDNNTKRWILLNDYPLTDDIQIYIPSLYGNKRFKHGGRFLPFSAKDEDYRSFAFHLDIPADSEHMYYLRVESEDSLAVILSILSPKRFAKKKHTNQLFLGIYYGFIFSMIIFYLFIYLSTRDLTHLYYVVTLFFLHFLFQFSLNGFSHAYINQDSLWWARDSIAFFETIGLVFAMQFAKVFLNIRKNARRFVKLTNIVIVAILAIAVLSLFFKYYYMIVIAVVVTMGAALLMWLVGIISYRNGFQGARFYLLSWTAIQFLGCFYGFKALGLFPSMFISEWGFQIGSLAHSVLMAFGMADLVNITFRATEATGKQQAALLETIKGIQPQIQHVVADLSEVSQSVADQASEHAITAKRVGLSIESVKQTADEMTIAALQSRDISAKTDAAAIASAKNLNQVTKGFSQTMPMIEQLEVEIGDLSTKISNTEEILVFIREIAQQINILAINAAIQAVHAGKRGRGFRVIASELRSMIHSIDSYLTHSHGLLADIRRKAQGSTVNTRETTRLIGHQVDQLRSVETAIGNISGTFGETSRQVDVIADASQKQKATVHEVAVAVDQLKAAADYLSASADTVLDNMEKLVETRKALDSLMNQIGTAN